MHVQTAMLSDPKVIRAAGQASNDKQPGLQPSTSPLLWLSEVP